MSGEWWTKGYPGGPMVKVPGFPRPLYPPDSTKQGKRPSSDGPDVVAYKRTVSRAGRWPWGTFDDTYSNGFSHGKAGGNVGDSGVAGVQRQGGLDDTGWIGEKTFNLLRSIRIPEGLPHAGEPAMDATAAKLVAEAWELYGGKEPADDKGAEERVRDSIVDFCNQGLANPGGWDYQLVRPLDVSVDPSGHVVADCSMSAIQAFNYAKRKTGVDVPDPAKQGYSGYGNTDYYEVDHPRVTSGSYFVGDLAHYGSGGDSSHVTVCIRAGDSSSSSWWSFGSEPPSRRSLYYRSDYLFVVRPPLV
jgi:hypothetical protein